MTTLCVDCRRLMQAVLMLMTVVACCQDGQADSALSSPEIRQAAQQVMQQHDYRAVRRRVLENIPTQTSDDGGFLLRSLNAVGKVFSDFFQWLLKGLSNQPRTPAPPVTQPVTVPPRVSKSGSDMDLGLSRLLLILALAVVVATVTWLASTAIKRRDAARQSGRPDFLTGSNASLEVSVPPGELAVSTYESRAVQMAAEDNFRAAIRELLLGSMSCIEREGLIRFRRGLTNRDYLRAIYREPDRRSAYEATAREFERIYFGRRSATRDAYETCLTAFQKAFRESRTSVSV
ncbi:MAG: DUF4129 domain-containing protein [Planctomycetaceae bacterium]